MPWGNDVEASEGQPRRESAALREGHGVRERVIRSKSIR